jgi:molybdenum cofactor biosynthesis protein B
MSHHEHQRRGPRRVACALVTVSDSRTAATDSSGRAIRAALERAGHQVVDQRILRDDARLITAHLRGLARRRSPARAVILTGGTGLAPRDRTCEAVERLLEKRIDGFGELFRMLSYREIGPAAMLTRAVAGTFAGRLVFSLPGSEAAVRLAMRRLILPELGHAVGLLEEET